MTNDGGHLKIKESFCFIKNFASQIENSLWMLDYAVLTSLYYTIVLWYPYYFLSLGLKGAAVYVTVMPSICMPLGSSVWGFFIDKFGLPLRFFIPLSLGISACLQVSLCFIELSEEMVWVWITTVGFSGFFIGYPWGYFASTELDLRTNGSREKSIVMAASRSYYNLVAFLFLVEVGFLM